MSKDKLMLVEGHDRYWQIQWYLADDGDMGATLGEDCSLSAEPKLLQFQAALDRGEAGEDLEHYAATVGAASQKEVEMVDGGRGFRWEKKRAAQEALKLANLRIKEARAGVAWPQWARDAVAHGWKPPKGWKP